MKKLFILIIFTIFQTSLHAQPSIQWQKCFGGTAYDGSYSIRQTTDGGYIVVGETHSNDGDVSGHNGGTIDVWFVKLNGLGIIQWQKCLGGSGDESAYSIQETTDGGFVIAGSTNSNDGDVIGNHGGDDSWVVKLNSLGFIQWQKCLGGTLNESANSIQQTTDGGYIITGYTTSNDGDVIGNHGFGDVWVAKLDSLGIIQWQKCLGGTLNESANSIQQTTDGGYILTGYTTSNDGDIIGNHGQTDFWVVKVDCLGIIQWQTCLGGTSGEYAESIQQTTDGGYILTGRTNSNDGNVTGNHVGGYDDLWLVKLDIFGIIQWQNCLGGTSNDKGYSVLQTADGGYILAGVTSSIDGDVNGNHGLGDVWVVKSNNSGVIQWQKCLGGTIGEWANSIRQTIDGGYVLSGSTFSNDGDVNGSHGNLDVWVVKLSSTVGVNELSSINSLNMYPNPTTDILNIESSIYLETIEVYDLMGRKVMSTSDQHLIDLSRVSVGMYTIRFISAEGIEVRRVEVSK